MRITPLAAFVLILSGAYPAVANHFTPTPGTTRVNLADVYQRQVRRNYLNTSRYLIDGRAIWLEGTPTQILRMSQWLDRIFQLPVGYATLARILHSGNRVTIRHSAWALHSSGRTLAPMTTDLTNGLGSDILILFDARIPDSGSHQVEDKYGNPIAFSATQNLFHELAHAVHLTDGTWRYWDSEGQAIELENRFRESEAQHFGIREVKRRSGISGHQIWHPDLASETTLVRTDVGL